MKIEDWGDTYYSGVGKAPGTWWPLGSMYVPHDRLKQVLARSARFHARQAISGFASDDDDLKLQAAISVGCAVELLAKAFIATVEHALLADKGDRDSLLILCGHPEATEISPTDLRSISASEALRHAKHLYKPLQYNPQTDQLLLRVRNSAAHMALVKQAELHLAVIAMCRVVEGLLLAIRLDRADFWGQPTLTVVDRILDAATSERQRVVTAKISVAKSKYSALFVGLGLDTASKKAIFAAIAQRTNWRSDEDHEHECPACGMIGNLFCNIEKTQPVRSSSPHIVEEYTITDRVAYPISFNCSVCDLELVDDELLEFDFPQEIELEPEIEYDDLNSEMDDWYDR